MPDSYLNIPHELLEESRKSWDYFISYKIVYLAEPRDGKYLGRKEGYIKDYIKGRLWFEFVAHTIGSQEQKLVWLVESCTHKLGVTCKSKVTLPVDWCDDSMFIYINQLTKDTEKFCFRPIPTIIRLKVIDDISGPIREIFNFANVKPGTNPVGFIHYSIQSNGERNSSFLFLGKSDSCFLTPKNSKCPSNMIEGCTQITQDVSDKQCPIASNSGVNMSSNNVRLFNDYPFNVIKNIQLALSVDGEIWLRRGTTDR